MAINRLLIFCEGQTEETFSNLVLEPHFRELGVHDVRPLLLPNKVGATSRRYKGGWNSYATARHFMRRVMLEQWHPTTVFTSLFDLYAIPEDFPGLAASPLGPPRDRIEALEQAMEADLAAEAAGRFFGRLQLHEYEALLLSDLGAVAHAFPDSVAGVTALRADIGGLQPEEVNEHRDTAPSKRIIRYIPQYEGLKTSAGPIIAAEIGLETLRQRCPHFGSWIGRIEAECAA